MRVNRIMRHSTLILIGFASEDPRRDIELEQLKRQTEQILVFFWALII